MKNLICIPTLTDRTKDSIITSTPISIFNIHVTHLHFLGACLVVYPGVDHLLHQIDKKESGQHRNLGHWIRSLVDKSLFHGVLEIGLSLREEVKEHDGQKNAGAEA